MKTIYKSEVEKWDKLWKGTPRLPPCQSSRKKRYLYLPMTVRMQGMKRSVRCKTKKSVPPMITDKSVHTCEGHSCP